MSKPNLVSNITLDKIDKLFENKYIEQPPWNFSMLSIYKDYIKPNLFSIIVFIFSTIFLSIRYYLKQEKNKNEYDKKKHNKKKKKYKNDYIVKYDDDTDLPILKTEKKNEFVSIDDLRSLYSDTDEPINDEYSIYDLGKEYLSMKKNNNGYTSNEMIDDLMKNTSSKYMFHELAKMISGN